MSEEEETPGVSEEEEEDPLAGVEEEEPPSTSPSSRPMKTTPRAREEERCGDGWSFPPPAKDGNSGTGTRYLTVTCMWMIFYPWVTPVPDPNRDWYGTGIFSHPRVTRRVPDT
jgi:hypothetical protein